MSAQSDLETLRREFDSEIDDARRALSLWRGARWVATMVWGISYLPTGAGFQWWLASASIAGLQGGIIVAWSLLKLTQRTRHYTQRIVAYRRLLGRVQRALREEEVEARAMRDELELAQEELEVAHEQFMESIAPAAPAGSSSRARGAR